MRRPGPIPFRRGPDGVYEVTAVDLFCGAGGTSTGLVQAVEEIEREYDIKIRLHIVAVNHWDVAISTHSANHKFAQHHCNSLKGVKPREVIKGPVDLLLASPECTHHSNARGGKPMDDQSRSSGDDVVRWADELRPGMITIENVREYRTWGPLDKHNRPIKSRKGEYFQRFLQQIRDLGYAGEDRLINCADNGDPTTRTRLFIYFKRGGGALTWPKATHAKDPAKLLVAAEKWRTARQDVIDWSDLGTSIFNRKRPLSQNTMRRIEAGLRKFSGIDLGGYLVKLYGTSTAASADDPVPTVTGQGGHIGLAVPFQIRTDCTGGKTAGVRGIDEPAATVVGSGGLGMVDPQAYIVPQFSQNPPRSVDQPVPTITTTSRGIGVAQPFLLGQNYCEERPAQPRSVDEPVPTVLAKGAISKVEPFMVAHFGEGDGQEPRTHSVDEPTPAVTSRGAAELVQPFIAEYHDDKKSEPRVKPVDEPLPTQDCANRFGLAQPFMLSAGGPEVAPRPVDEPAHTVLTRDHIGVASPFITTAGGPEGQGRTPQSVDEPIGTVIGENHRAVIEPFVIGAGGPARAGEPQTVDKPVGAVIGRQTRAVIVPVTHPDQPGQDPASRTRSVDAPLPTITTAHRGELGLAQTSFILPKRGRYGNNQPRSVEDPVQTVVPHHGAGYVVSASLVQYNGTGTARSVDEPIGTMTAKPRFALLVTFTTGEKVLLDILFRMLRPRELARAQSFPDTYEFSGKTKDIVKQIGNAVPVKTAKALCKTALMQLPQEAA